MSLDWSDSLSDYSNNDWSSGWGNTLSNWFGGGTGGGMDFSSGADDLFSNVSDWTNTSPANTGYNPSSFNMDMGSSDPYVQMEEYYKDPAIASQMYDNAYNAQQDSNPFTTVGGWLGEAGKTLAGNAAKNATPKNLFSLGSALYGYMQNKKGNQAATNYAQQYRNQSSNYSNQLAALQANPDATLKNMGAYRYAQDTAMNAAKRQAAATGHAKSGNLLTALQDRANNVASTWYNQEANRLERLGAMNTQAANNAYAGQLANKYNTTGLASNIGRYLFG